MDTLHESGDLDFNTDDLVGERVDVHFICDAEGFAVVFDGVLGLERDVGVVEGFAELFGNGFGVLVESADYVVVVNVIRVQEGSRAEEYTTYNKFILAGGSWRGGGGEMEERWRRDGTYKNTAPDTENGWALNNSFDALQNGREDWCLRCRSWCEMQFWFWRNASRRCCWRHCAAGRRALLNRGPSIVSCLLSAQLLWMQNQNRNRDRGSSMVVHATRNFPNSFMKS